MGKWWNILFNFTHTCNAIPRNNNSDNVAWNLSPISVVNVFLFGGCAILFGIVWFSWCNIWRCNTLRIKWGFVKKSYKSNFSWNTFSIWVERSGNDTPGFIDPSYSSSMNRTLHFPTFDCFRSQGPNLHVHSKHGNHPSMHDMCRLSGRVAFFCCTPEGLFA